MVLAGVGRRVAELRSARGWTQDQFSERIGIDPTHLRKIEGGRLGLNVYSLVRLANGLGCESVAELFVEPTSREVRPGRPRGRRPAPEK